MNTERKEELLDNSMQRIEEDQNQYDMSFLENVAYDRISEAGFDNKKSVKNTLNDGNQSSAIHSDILSSLESQNDAF